MIAQGTAIRGAPSPSRAPPPRKATAPRLRRLPFARNNAQHALSTIARAGNDANESSTATPAAAAASAASRIGIASAAAAVLVGVLALVAAPPPPASAAAAAGPAPDAAALTSLFAGKCAGCHAGGGNLLQASATLRTADLERNGYADPEALYALIYGGKGRMPGFGADCAPKGACTFGARLSDAEVRGLGGLVLRRAGEGWAAE